MQPDEILDRTDACRILGISRQTLLAWIRKGKLKVWKRVGHGSNSALLFQKSDIDALIGEKNFNTTDINTVGTPATPPVNA